ncbi:MAG: hypothetical protein SOZ06_00020 [Candidatus Faecenecus gallistercoris]|nr:hypothetical protein [Bacillota bacterium]MDD7103211.1 hypothetical protein [Bacillota bacterium]MDY4050348.1 hypothetical protein [Candidatus Faecenecus gallistercoris]
MKRTIQDIAYFILSLSLQLLVWAFIHLSWMGSTDYVLLSALLLVCFLLILSDFACFVVVISHIIKDGSDHKLKLLLLTIFLKPFYVPYYYATKMRTPKLKVVPIIEIFLIILFLILFMIDFTLWVQTPMERDDTLSQTMTFHHMQYELPKDFTCEIVDNTMTCNDPYETFGTSLIYYTKAELNDKEEESYFDAILATYEKEEDYQVIEPKSYHETTFMAYYTTSFRAKVEGSLYLFQLSLFENDSDEIYILIQLSNEVFQNDAYLMDTIEENMKYYNVGILA